MSLLRRLGSRTRSSMNNLVDTPNSNGQSVCGTLLVIYGLSVMCRYCFENEPLNSGDKTIMALLITGWVLS